MAPEADFQQLIGALRRRSRLILTIAAFGAILAGATGLLIAPKYTATAQIVVEPQAAAVLSPDTVQQAMDTHVAMLTSANHMQHVVDSLRNKPESGSAAPETSAAIEVSASGIDGDARSPSVVTAQSPAKPSTPEAGPLSFNELKRRLNVWTEAITSNRGGGTRLAIDDFARRLKVMQERRSRVITISFQWTSPQKAAVIANRIVELYVSNLTEQQRAYNAGEMAQLERRIAAIKSNVEQTSAVLHKAIQSPFGAGSEQQQAEVDPRELARRAATSAQVYASLLQRQKEMREQRDLMKPDAHVFSLASPPARPSSPNPILFMVPALIASLICGGLLAVVLEGLDRGLRCEREVSDALGISCIGLVPQIPRGRATHVGDYLLAEPFSNYAEAIRSAVAKLRLAEPGHASRVILISSSIPGEGKTTLAQSLATLVGLLGRRVLLVDLDVQRRSRPGEFDDTGERGILSLQSRPQVERIRHIAEAGFDYLPPGHRLDPLTLFAPEQMPGFIRQLRELYDCVIIDGPPALGAVEAQFLPSIADQLLFVVKWGSTRREVAQNAMSLLHGSGAFNKDRGHLALAIVTRVDLKRHAQYRYGDVGELLVAGGKSPLNRERRRSTRSQQREPLDTALLFLPHYATGSSRSRE
jgi:uncharacterized protein involved in exopolysaccharide biosynthesis